MIQSVSDVSDLPPQILEEYRKKGWPDEEILENFADAVNFLNSHIRCCVLDEAISLARIFSQESRSMDITASCPQPPGMPSC